MTLRAPDEPHDSFAGEALTRRALLFVLAVALTHIALAWIVRLPGIGWGEDDAGYLLLAKDLTQLGYRELQDIEAPTHARFPPGFPFVLALAGPLVGWRVELLTLLVTVCSAGAILFFFDAARRVVGLQIALVTAVLLAVNPVGLRDAGMLMAEAPFKLWTAVGLWGVTRERDDPRFAFVAGAGVIMGALTRSAGVVFVVGLLAYWVLTKQYRRATLFGVAAALTVGAWLAWSFTAPDPENRRLYVADLGLRGSRTEGESFVTSAFDRLAPRLRTLATRVLPSTLAFPTVRGTAIDNAFWLVLYLGAVAAGVFALRHRWRSFLLLLASYLALLVLWRWSNQRFASPFAPFLIVAILVGAATIARRWGVKAQALIVTGIGALLVVGAAQQGRELFARRIECHRRAESPGEQCFPESEQTFFAMARWVRDSTPPEALFFVSKERAFYLHSGRLTINQDRALQEDSLSLAPYLRSRGVTHTVVGAIGVRQAQHGRLLASACRDLVLLRRFSPESGVFRIRGAHEPGDGGAACELLGWWARLPRVRG